MSGFVSGEFTGARGSRPPARIAGMKNPPRLRTLTTACSVLLLSACAAGGGGGRSQDGRWIEGISFERFDAADTDHDGKLSRAEVEPAFPQLLLHFGRLDSDKSGFLSWNELKYFGPPRRSR